MKPETIGYRPVYTEMLTAKTEDGETYTFTVNGPTRTFSWPLVQPKPSLWRRVLRLVRR